MKNEVNSVNPKSPELVPLGLAFVPVAVAEWTHGDAERSPNEEVSRLSGHQACSRVPGICQRHPSRKARFCLYEVSEPLRISTDDLRWLQRPPGGFGFRPSGRKRDRLQGLRDGAA